MSGCKLLPLKSEMLFEKERFSTKSNREDIKTETDMYN